MQLCKALNLITTSIRRKNVLKSRIEKERQKEELNLLFYKRLICKHMQAEVRENLTLT